MYLKVNCLNNRDRFHKNTHELDIYFGITENFLAIIPEFYTYLSDKEKSRAARFKFESEYNCYITVHALLRIKLSKLLNVDPRSIKIEENEFGKPFLPYVDLPFSISKNKNAFAFAIGRSNQYIGIDIEQIKPDFEIKCISNNFFNIKEQQMISSLQKAEEQINAFFEIWTRKEALLKAVGIGINEDISQVLVLDGENYFDIKGLNIKTDQFVVNTSLINKVLISIASSVVFLPGFKHITSTNITGI